MTLHQFQFFAARLTRWRALCAGQTILHAWIGWRLQAAGERPMLWRLQAPRTTAILAKMLARSLIQINCLLCQMRENPWATLKRTETVKHAMILGTTAFSRYFQKDQHLM